jgi:hypothetical protein
MATSLVTVPFSFFVGPRTIPAAGLPRIEVSSDSRTAIATRHRQLRKRQSLCSQASGRSAVEG